MNFMEFAAENARTEFQSRPAAPNMAGVIARCLDMNDAQWQRREISHRVWSDTYIALLNYATRHGIAEEVLR